MKKVIVELFSSTSKRRPESKSMLMNNGKKRPEAQSTRKKSYHMHVINGSSFLLKAGVLSPIIH